MLKYHCRLRNLINLKTGFYKDLDTNFAQACELSEKDLSHKELVTLLKYGNIPEKQIAALKFDCVNNQEEADLLLDNLTGCDGKIREAIAFRINRFLSENPDTKKFFFSKETANIFADATIDINANICRLVVDSVALIKSNKEFSETYLKRILDFIEETFTALDNFIFRDKKYVINKQLFKLYWSLEALKYFTEETDKNTMLHILMRVYKEKEYTVREKAAQIVILLNDEAFDELKNLLKNDENYYVKNVFKS